jgi:hypothetical protein
MGDSTNMQCLPFLLLHQGTIQGGSENRHLLILQFTGFRRFAGITDRKRESAQFSLLCGCMPTGRTFRMGDNP